MPKTQEPGTTEENANTAEHEKNVELNVRDDDDQKRKPMFPFSIDYILNKAGDTINAEADTDKQNSQQFDWLYCTRFKPPKLDSK